MSRKLGGIIGVLNDLVAPLEPVKTPPTAPRPVEAAPAKSAPKTKPKPPKQAPAAAPVKKAAVAPPSVKARLGRTPGSNTSKTGPKRKITLWVNAELMDRIVDWSWERRCNLGGLVEEALRDYHRRYRRAGGGEQASG